MISNAITNARITSVYSAIRHVKPNTVGMVGSLFIFIITRVCRVGAKFLNLYIQVGFRTCASTYFPKKA